jgi:capsular exopolysaccharide synthesis family protein
LVKDEKKGAEENNVTESFNIVSSKKIVENELVVIQSATLLNNVVKDLALYAPVYEKGKVRDNAAYNTSPIVVKAVNPDAVTEQKSVAFKYDAKSRSVVIAGKAYPINKQVETPNGELVFEINPHFKKNTDRPLYFHLLEPKMVTTDLSKRLDVTAAGKLSSIVQLTLKDEVPERAEDILNKLIEDYNNASVEYKNTIAKNTVAFLDDRLRVVEKELNNVEKQIQKYKSDNDVVDISEQGRMYLQNVGDNDQKLSELNMQLAVLGQVENYVSSKENKAGLVPSTLGVTDPQLSGLLDKLYQNELEYEKLKKTTAENHPIMQSLESQIDKIRPSILENIKSQRNGLLASRNNLSRTNNNYGAILSTLPKKERELIDVSRQQSIKNGIYSFLLQKREESALAFASNVADSKVVQAAQAGLTPVSPKKGIIFLGSLLIAFVLGIGYVQLKELFSNKIMFRTEIEENTSIPIVAEISNFDQVKNIQVKGNSSMIDEQFRQLRAATGLLNKGKTRRKILVTSSIPGEGKSLVSKNLAINLSLSGKKVVLVDLDLRNPQTTKAFNLTESKGVGEFLESEIEPYEVIKSTEYNHLHVIPAGTSETNATELILSDRLKQLFDYLEDAFEYLIIDTSPVNPLADAYILADYCDLTLYVVRHKYTPKACIKRLDETNKLKNLNNMAIVFNDVQPRGFMNRTYGFGYGYGYEYGYEKTSSRFQVRPSFFKLFNTARIKRLTNSKNKKNVVIEATTEPSNNKPLQGAKKKVSKK